MRKQKFLIFPLILALLLVMIVPVAGAEESENTLMEKSFYETILRSELNYVSGLTFSNGAIGMTTPIRTSYANVPLPEAAGVSPSEYTTWRSAKVLPYFSAFACLGVADAERALGTKDYGQVIKNHLEWYFAHMNTAESDLNGVAGTVYDYYVFQNADDGRLIEVKLHDAFAADYTQNPSENPNDYDSTDSYAAVTLRLMQEYASYYDASYLEGKQSIVDILVAVIRATLMENSGVTGAKPNYMVAYLMDNCEVWNGLRAASAIYRIYGNTEEAAACDALASGIRNSLLTAFWNEKDQAFSAGVFEDGTLAYATDSTALQHFYPEGSSQLFPLIFGVITSDDERAELLYARFTAQFCQIGVTGSDWTSSDVDAYPWAILAKATLAMNDYTRTDRFLNAVYRIHIRPGHKSPYYNAEAGHILTVAAALYSQAADVSAEESSELSAPLTESNAGSISSSSVSPAEDTDAVSPWWYIGIGAAVAALAVVFAVYGKKATDKKKGRKKNSRK